MAVALKRAYDPPSASDGYRVLVDRLWPRGISKETAKINLWLREVAPSTELRRWFHEKPQLWRQFRSKYLQELSAPDATRGVEQLHEVARGRGRLTLIFASRNVKYNNAVVLKELLEGMRKPPSSTGPLKPAARRRSRMAR